MYKARDPRLNRNVTIKVLTRAKCETSQGRTSLLREARAASALNHPNIVTIRDAVSEGGQDAIVMEYSGRTLQETIGREALPLGKILEYGIQIAGALAAAHGANVIHRDLKPGNVMITEAGAVKVLDFGLARLPISRDADTASLTGEGAIAGTLSYMSPEQARGQALDTRSDLFSFGIVLYEMATGELPFQGNTPAVIFEALLNRTPERPLRLNPHVPPRLDRIILQLVEKDRALRYGSAVDLHADLESLRTTVDARRPARASRKRAIFAFATVLAATAARYSATRTAVHRQRPR